MLVTLVHGAETTKFVAAWVDYKAGIRELAMGEVTGPNLRDPTFVSAERLGVQRNRMAWESTTPFLSVLLAPNLTPKHLVVDPYAGYFWLPCDIAKRSELKEAGVPAESRRLIRRHACLHR